MGEHEPDKLSDSGGAVNPFDLFSSSAPSRQSLPAKGGTPEREAQVAFECESQITLRKQLGGKGDFQPLDGIARRIGESNRALPLPRFVDQLEYEDVHPRFQVHPPDHILIRTVPPN